MSPATSNTNRPASSTTGGAAPAARGAPGRQLCFVASVGPLLLALLGCTLTGGNGDSSPQTRGHASATPAARASDARLHPTGFVPDPQVPPAPAVVYAGPPTGYVDLSANNPPVGDQLQSGPCTAWATGYYLRGWFAKRDGYYPPTGFAPMYTYAQIVHGVFDAGSTFAQNLDIQQTQGLDTSGDYAHASEDSVEQPTDAERTNAARYKIARYSEVSNPDHSVNFMMWIVNRLLAGEPVALGILVFPAFRDASPDHWFVGAPADPSTVLGGHAVFVYGYDYRGLLIENQWGTGWGNGGYAELSWDYVIGYGVEAVSILPKDPPPSWQQLPGAATDISVGADGSVWALGVTPAAGGYDIYRWNATTWTWNVVSGAATRIAVDPKGDPWIISSTGAISHWDGTGWQRAPGVARDIAAGGHGSGGRGSVWMIGASVNSQVCQTRVCGTGSSAWIEGMAGHNTFCIATSCDGPISQWTGSTWQTIPGSASRVAVDPSGLPWVVTAFGAISRWAGSAWMPLPGAAKDIAIGGPHCNCTDIPWVIGADSGLYQWDWLSNTWQSTPGSAVDIAAGPSYNLWVISSDGAIFQLPAPADL